MRKDGSTPECAAKGVATVKMDHTATPTARTVFGGYRVAMYPPTRLVTVYLRTRLGLYQHKNFLGSSTWPWTHGTSTVLRKAKEIQ
jgi:hypothetical protein